MLKKKKKENYNKNLHYKPIIIRCLTYTNATHLYYVYMIEGILKSEEI